jgi:CBS-domain-containing membrane protein
MTTWRVKDVMTTDVITAPDDATLADIVTLLTDRQITAVPITDRFDAVLGVVSWTDLRRKIELAEPDDGAGRPHPWAPVQWPEGTAVEVMSGPALTIGADVSLAAAARVMYRRAVGRLLVVDRDRKLRGIVTRSDLLKVHARLDAVIRDEVLHQVLGHPLMIPAGTVGVTVADGVVTLTGRTADRSTAITAARLTAAVPGVTGVDDRLEFDVDDTAAPRPAHRPAPRDPLRGWWPVAGGRQPKPPMVAVADRGRGGGSA